MRLVPILYDFAHVATGLGTPRRYPEDVQSTADSVLKVNEAPELEAKYL